MQHKWGIIGTSLIAYEVSYAIKFIKGNQIIAVLSKKKENAQRFAKKIGLLKIYENLNDFLDDPEITIVYIATPNYTHSDFIKACFEKGKHVLCEKPICPNSHELREIKSMSVKHNLFCMEANWVIFNPAMQKLFSLLKSGKVGEIRSISGSFGHLLNESKETVDDTGTGVLLDLGVYLIAICIKLLGKPDKVFGSEEFDGRQSAFSLVYKQNITASFTCSQIADLKNEFTIVGTKGIITVKDPFYRSGFLDFVKKESVSNKTSMDVKGDLMTRNYYGYPLFFKYAPFIKRIYNRIKIGSFITPFIGNSYHYQVKEVNECIFNGFVESKTHPIENSIATLEVIEFIKRKIK
jgi:dihydrodiol dehydrogenase / D-xylose 1-dehydrogenase (NADP)